VGARPQFIKCAPLSKQLKNYFDEIIVHTGQHYDDSLSASFFTELGIEPPKYNLQVGSGSATWQIAIIMMKLDEVFEIEKPDCVVVFGDTNSTAAAAIVAAKHKIKIAHIEAGLREFDKTIPEETNKLITDILCDYYFCPTNTAVDILKSMGITKDVFNVGDVMIDIIFKNYDKIKANESIFFDLNITKKNYILFTCHRASNTDNAANLEQILSAINVIDETVVFPMHPRTKKFIEKNNLGYLIDKKNIITTLPLGYFDTQSLILNSKYVITDSGGITKEAYFYKVQGVLVDKQTEWVETINEGWNLQAGPNTKSIINSIALLGNPKAHSNCLGNGQASEKIAEILNQILL